MAEAVVIGDEGAQGDGGFEGGFEALAGLNEGFLGTGYSTAVELSLVVLSLILGYAAISTVRYLFPDLRVIDSVADALGLRDR